MNGIGYNSLFNILYLIGLTFSIWNIYLIYRFGPKNNMNRFFILTMAAISIYLFTSFIIANLSIDSKNLMIWEKICFISAIMVSAFYLHFMSYFPNKNEISGFFKIFILLTYINMVLLLLLIPGNRLLSGVTEYDRLIFGTAGDLYFLFIIYFIICTVGAISIGTLKYFEINEPVKKKQAGLVTIGGLVAAIGAILEMYLPIANLYIPFTGISITIMGMIVVYAIIRYGAFNVEKLAQEGFFLSVSSSVISIVYILIIFGFATFIKEIDFSVLAFSSLFIILLIFALHPLKEIAEKHILERYYGDIYRQRRVLEDFGQKLTYNLNLMDLCNSIVMILKENIGLSKAMIFLYQPNNLNYLVIASTDPQFNNISFYPENGIYKSKSPNGQDFIYWSLKNEIKQNENGFSQSELNKIPLFSLALYSKEKFIGLIGLGPKINGQKFYMADYRLLSSIAQQAAIAIDNAQLYQKVISQKNKMDILMKQIDNAHEVERRKISRELHDKIAQNLAGIILSLDYLRSKSQFNKTDFNSDLELIQSEVKNTIEQMREIVYQLKMNRDQDLDFKHEVNSLFESFSQDNNTRTKVSIKDNLSFCKGIEAKILIRVVKEILYNIKKHAQASEVNCNICLQDNYMKISITDNGIGFEPGRIFREYDKLKTYGLVSIRENILEMDGEFIIKSKPGNGTNIEILLDKNVLSESKIGIY